MQVLRRLAVFLTARLVGSSWDRAAARIRTQHPGGTKALSATGGFCILAGIQMPALTVALLSRIGA